MAKEGGLVVVWSSPQRILTCRLEPSNQRQQWVGCCRGTRAGAASAKGEEAAPCAQGVGRQQSARSSHLPPALQPLRFGKFVVEPKEPEEIASLVGRHTGTGALSVVICRGPKSVSGMPAPI